MIPSDTVNQLLIPLLYSQPVARFGSEPDLRFTGREFMSYAPPPPHHTTESPSKQRISRSRKKYKAPTPVTNGVSTNQLYLLGMSKYLTQTKHADNLH